VTTVRITLPAGTMAVPTARHFTSDTLLSWGLPERAREITELVVSELVGNAIEHGGGRAELVVSLLSDTVRVDVLDRDPRPPVVLSPEPVEDRHRGLLIVAALSTRWGTHRVGAGKSVWAELPCVPSDLDVVLGDDIEGDLAAPRPATADDRSMSG
jgi:anti-sigma regulatory factor (Ser/Thr protein kinase)